MFYDHKRIEKYWQDYWQKNNTFKSYEPKAMSQKPKYYVLDMFPYPSGAGLHVGHPLGYIASDIMARFKRHQGFNVLHPIGYDSFGLPAEQYAIQTGQHPAITTEKNISRYEEQLRKIGFSFDWSREVRTSDPAFYKWTQWIFIELFHSWYNKTADKAEPVSTLIEHFEKFGTENLNTAETEKLNFTAEEWNTASEKDKQDILLNYRMAFRAETTVNWCPALGTVLANDEVKDGKSERGGYPVFQKKMLQWSMRISAYSERLLQGLQNIDWPQPLKDSQEYWIGKSVGAEIRFPLSPKGGNAANTIGENYFFPTSKEENSTNTFGESASLNSERGNAANTFGEILTEKNARFGYLTGGNNSVLNLKNAQANRDNMTEAESILWELLMSKKLGYKFRRQHLIDDFIVDFVCLSKGFVIEVDGAYHDSSEQQISDAERTKILENKGYKVIRFKNEEVIGDTDRIISEIKENLENQPDFKQGLSDDENPENQPQFSPLGERGIEIFTTRPDTIFGATFMVLAPEHPLVEKIATAEQKSEVENYQQETSKKTERDRMADVKNVSGAFTGSYAVNPFTQKKMPIYISDYVLMGYGTGAVMAVPAHDERDHRFAKKFGLEIMNVIKNDKDIQEESYDSKDSVCVNSGFLDGLNYNDAKAKIIAEIEEMGIGHGTTNYRQRDAIFSRQRYWGEPVPVYFKDEMPYTLPLSALPLELPEVEKYLPTEDGDPPLGNARNFAWDEANQKVVSVDLINNKTVFPMELSTMPGWAGSSWYFLRYMDPKNDSVFTDKNLSDYWGQVDLYIGGSEHATGHLLYSRFWNMFLKDRGYIEQEEPFKKLINQGMILGMSAFVFRIGISDFREGFINKTENIHINEEEEKAINSLVNLNNKLFISKNKIPHQFFTKYQEGKTYNSSEFKTIRKEILNAFFKHLDFERIGYSFDVSLNKIHVDISLLKGTSDELDTEAFKNWRPEFADAEFIFENGESSAADSSLLGRSGGAYIVEREVEKMSKSKYNVVNPDDICDEYGADCLRLYEMFLGPLEQSKPWNTQGLSGVYGFLKKFYNLYYNGDSFEVSDAEPTKEELKVLHTLIKKVLYDLDHFSFNTSVSSFMIAVNELQKLKCNKRAILEPVAIVISPYAPHICEELWEKLGHSESIEFAPFPELNESYLIEDEIEYPVSFNGKMKFKIPFPAETSAQEIEDFVRKDAKVLQILEGSEPKKIIIVPKKIINIVL